MCTNVRRPLRFSSSLLLSEGTSRVPRPVIEPRTYRMAGRRANHWATPHPYWATPNPYWATPQPYTNVQYTDGYLCAKDITSVGPLRATASPSLSEFELALLRRWDILLLVNFKIFCRQKDWRYLDETFGEKVSIHGVALLKVSALWHSPCQCTVSFCTICQNLYKKWFFKYYLWHEKTKKY